MSIRLTTLFLSFFLAFALVGCTQPAEQADETAAAALPEGAVDIGGGLLQVPVGEDEDGYTQYRLQWADTGEQVGSSTYYRLPTGTFTTDRSVVEATSDD